jgi:phosphatidylglycerol---prolipoprotein diacylglyceryl transferase
VRPVLFTVAGRPVRSYPAMLYLGLVAGLAAGNAAANAAGLDGWRVYVASVVLVVPAILGARLASVAANRDGCRVPGSVWRRSQGGQAMYGGLVVVPLSVPLLAALSVPFWPFWDAGTFTLLTGMAFARVGCLLTGCCAGRPTTGRFGLVLADSRGVRTRRVPTQLLEGAVALVLLAATAVAAATEPPPGALFAGALGAYSFARLFLQPLRERQRRLAGVPVLGLASAGLFAVAVLSIVPRIA